MAKAKKRAKHPKEREGITDVHVHIQPWKMLKPEVANLMHRGRGDPEKLNRLTESPYEFLKYMDACGLERVVCMHDVSPDVTGLAPDVSDWTAKFCSEAPDRLLAVGSVHPRLATKIEEDLEHLCGDLKVRLLKIHPAHQLVYPNEYRDGLQNLGVIYRRAQEYRIPVVIHTGTSVFQGARNKYAHPMHCDDVGVDFPELTVILAHGGRPLWMDEAFFLIRRHPRFFMDISSIPMKRLLDYFPRIEEVADKVLYGSDWPGPQVPDLRMCVDQFEHLPIGEAAKKKILVTNARHLIP